MRLITFCFLLILPLAAFAQTHTLHFLSGTGFFINNDGQVVTNAHVLGGCARITVQGAVAEVEARLKAMDNGQDLALLDTRLAPPAYASLRPSGMPPIEGEQAFSVGYPGGERLATRPALILHPYGPSGEPEWLQFSDSAARGNSGGPLLDSGAYVLGMVMAKATLTTRNLSTGDSTSRTMDVAIQSSALAQFLRKHHARYREDNANGGLNAERVQDRAKEFVVNVRCWK